MIVLIAREEECRARPRRHSLTAVARVLIGPLLAVLVSGLEDEMFVTRVTVCADLLWLMGDRPQQTPG